MDRPIPPMGLGADVQTGALTEKQVKILIAMRKFGRPATPTEIGESCGVPYERASSWFAAGIKGAAVQGCFIRLRENGRVVYALTDGAKSLADAQAEA